VFRKLSDAVKKVAKTCPNVDHDNSKEEIIILCFRNKNVAKSTKKFILEQSLVYSIASEILLNVEFSISQFDINMQKPNLMHVILRRSV